MDDSVLEDRALASLVAYGAGFYRNLFVEAGLVGQVLYLQAEAAQRPKQTGREFSWHRAKDFKSNSPTC